MKIRLFGDMIAELARRADTLAGELEHAQAALSMARKALSEQAADLKKAREAEELARARALDLTERMKVQRDATIDALTEERDAARAAEEKLRLELQEACAKLPELRGTVEALEAELTEARAGLADVDIQRGRAERAEAELAALREEEARLGKILRDLLDVEGDVPTDELLRRWAEGERTTTDGLRRDLARVRGELAREHRLRVDAQRILDRTRGHLRGEQEELARRMASEKQLAELLDESRGLCAAAKAEAEGLRARVEGLREEKAAGASMLHLASQKIDLLEEELAKAREGKGGDQ